MRATITAIFAGILLLSLNIVMPSQSEYAGILPYSGGTRISNNEKNWIFVAEQVVTQGKKQTLSYSGRLERIGQDFIIVSNTKFFVSGKTIVTNINGIPTMHSRLIGNSLVNVEFHQDIEGRNIADSISVTGKPLAM